MFVKATKKRSRLRLAIIGPAGSGKTMTALRIARGIAGPAGRIAVLDSEAGSASKYADKIDFDTVEPSTFAPEKYIEIIAEAAKAGYNVLVIDSLSHAWMGKDGILSDVDKAAKRAGGNGFGAWRDATPRQVALIDAIIRAPLHIVCTIRSKVEHVAEKDERGKTVIRKIGLQPVQREGLEYEFDVVGDIDDAHALHVTKSRYSDIADETIVKPGEALGAKLRAWLEDGAEPPPPPPPPREPETTDRGWAAVHSTMHLIDSAVTVEMLGDLFRTWMKQVNNGLGEHVAPPQRDAVIAYCARAKASLLKQKWRPTEREQALVDEILSSIAHSDDSDAGDAGDADNADVEARVSARMRDQ